MIIRSFRPDDSIPRITSILNAAYSRLLDLGLKYVATAQGDDVTARRIQKGRCFVAELDGQIVGSIVYEDQRQTNGCPWYDRPEVASFHQFGVDPAHQQHGVGRALLAHVEGEAVLSGAKELALDTAEWAYHLINWYGSLGYRLTGEAQWRDVNYKSVLMSLNLESRTRRDHSRAPLGPVVRFLRSKPTEELKAELQVLESRQALGPSTRRRHEVYGRIGELHRMLGNTKEAFVSLERAAAAAVERGDERALRTQQLRLGIAYHYAGRHGTANYVFEQMLRVFDGDPERLGYVHQHYGKCLVEQGRLDDALGHFRKAEAYRSEEGTAEALRQSTAEAIDETLNLINDRAHEGLAPGSKRS